MNPENDRHHDECEIDYSLARAHGVSARQAAENVERNLARLRYVAADSKRRNLPRTPATINPDDRDKWRGFAQSYAHMGRPVDLFVREAIAYSAFGSGCHFARTLAAENVDAEVAAFRAELGDIFPAPADQPLPMVRFSQAGVSSARGAL